QELDALDVLLDHEVTPLAEGGVVEAHAVGAGEAELGALLGDPMEEVGGLEHRLGGDAAAVEAGAAHSVALDEPYLQPELRGANGADVAHPAAEDQDVEVL